nr:hypothetical protein [Tanacetum cinerariifolium]
MAFTSLGLDKYKGTARSKEDDISALYQSIFITNFPPACGKKELWEIGKRHGVVVDVFIPNHLSKAGKRFAFMKFIRIQDVDKVVAFFREEWVGNFHLFACKPRSNTTYKPNSLVMHKLVAFLGKNGWEISTYLLANPMGDRDNKVEEIKVIEKHVIMLESTTSILEHSMRDRAVFAKVNHLLSIPTLKKNCDSEGFLDVSIKHVGGLWVLIEFQVNTTRNAFLKHKGMENWLTKIISWSRSFVPRERSVWLGIEGIPLMAWSNDSIKRVARKEIVMAHLEVDVEGKRYDIWVKDVTGWKPSFKNNDSQTSKVEVNKPMPCKKEDIAFEVSDNEDEQEDKDQEEREINENSAENSSPSRPPGFGSHLRKPPSSPTTDSTAAEGQQNAAPGATAVTMAAPAGSDQHSRMGSENLKRFVGNPDLFTKDRIISHLHFVVVHGKWKQYLMGVSIIMGDFNVVRYPEERFGSQFDSSMAHDFNDFMKENDLINPRLGGYQYTWVNKMATKMCKIDQFLLSEGVTDSFTNIVATILDKGIPNHQPIMLHEVTNDYGPTLFRFFHYWLDCADFEELAVWDCGSDKSPGPDGFTFDFFKRFWHVPELDIVRAVTYFHRSNKFPKGFNSSFITLIPKVADPVFIKNYRPISLIGSMYKIICKLLANRLAKVVGDLISSEQPAFIKRRQIMDGPMILNEIRGFLTSSRASVLVNGSPTDEFLIHRGLRQGDPLSSFLFTLVVEALHMLIERAKTANLVQGIWLDMAGTVVSHLLYVNDAILLGLKINLGKCRLMGVGVQMDDVQNMATVIWCEGAKLPFVYLGVQVGANMNRIAEWDEVIKKFKTRLFTWKAKTLLVDGSMGNSRPKGDSGSIWFNILKSVRELDNKNANLDDFVSKKVGDGRWNQGSWIAFILIIWHPRCVNLLGRAEADQWDALVNVVHHYALSP